MPDYKTMYYELYRLTTETIERLQRGMQAVEDLYFSDENVQNASAEKKTDHSTGKQGQSEKDRFSQ